MNVTGSFTSIPLPGSFVFTPPVPPQAPAEPAEPAETEATKALPDRRARRPKAPRHRLAKVRRQQGLSVRSAARRMGITMSQVRLEERPDSDLSLEDLVRWQRALEVPLIDLLIDQDAPLSSPVVSRARWLRLMKTVKALLEASPTESIKLMAQMLEQQVLEVMPELKDVGAWHSVGQRRTHEEFGRIMEQPVPSTFARDAMR